jgi:hypothetical protein
MTKPTDIGMNRTGIATSPIDSKKTIKAAKQAAATTNGHQLEVERVRWARSAEPVGTVPPPGTVKGVVKTVVEAVEGHQPNVFIDKLGERLAFERTGSRLYEALLVKYEVAHVHEGGPTRQELEKIRDDERRHFAIVRDAMRQLGVDPTAMTPSADVMGVAGGGFIQAVTDPRTTLTQCLVVTLIAELADNDGWALLVDLAEALGHDDLARQFRDALTEEEDHLIRVRGWIDAAVLGQAGVSPTAPQPAA